MSSSNPVGENPDRSCLVPIPHSLRDPKSTVSEKIEGSSLGIPSRKLTVATTSLRPDSFDNRRPLSPLLSRSPVSTPNGNPESRKNWSTDTSRQGDRPSAVSATGTDVTSGGCVSPPENLHANKWAQIIIRARQRQVQGETTGSGFPTCPTEPACVDLKQELPSAAVLASDFKMPPSRLVEMWFSKKRPRKTESGIPGDGGEGSSTGANGSADRNAEQETTQHKNSSIIKSSGGKDKKPALSMGKVLAKKDEKETGEDLEFKRQCKLELEKRLSECGFGIHAPAKERQTKERKAREAKRHRNTVLDAASQTDLQFEAQGLDLTSNTTTNVIDGSTPSGMNGANIASGSGIGSNRDRPPISNCTEMDLDDQSSTLKARSLPENFHTQVGKTSPSYADSAGRYSLVSLKPEQTEPEFHPPARRTRSLLDSFRDVACKALWRRPQRTSKANVPSLASSSDLTTNSNASNVGGAAGECSNSNSNGVDSKSSPKKGAEESKASVLNQDKVVHGNVLRSVVFYQNRFIVMHHSKSNTKKTNSPEKTQNLEKISTENVSPCAGKDVNPENGSSVSEGNNSTENPCSSKDQSFGNKCDNEAPSCKNRLQSSQSYSGVGTAGQPLLSLAGAADTRSCLAVDVSPTHCLKSESDMELEFYYNRVQDLNLEHGRLRSPIGARSEYQSGHVDDVDFAKDRKVSSHKDCAQKSDGIESHQSNTDKSPQEQKEDSCEASACVSVGPKGNPRSPSYDGKLGKTSQPPVKGKERRSKSSSSYHDKEDGFIELEVSGRTSSSRSRSRRRPQEQNENTKQGHNSRHRERYIPRTDKRVSDYKLSESGISNEFFNEIIPARDKQQTLPSENTILKQDHEIVENSRRHGRSTKRSCTKSLDRNALPEGAMESKHKDWRIASEAVEADVVKAGCSSDALRHHKQVHQSGKKSDHILNEETNDHQKYRDCSHGKQEQHYPGSSHGNIDRHSFSDYFHPNQDRRTKRETTRPRKDREKCPLFVDDARKTEEFCEPTHVNRRDNKSVQFQDDEFYISEASPRGVSPRQIYSHQRQEFKLEEETDYKYSVSDKQRTRHQRTVTPKHTADFEETLEVGESRSQTRRVKNHSLVGESRHANTRSKEHTHEDLLDDSIDYRETGTRSNRNIHRGNGDSQHRGNGVSQHRGNGVSQHRGNGDSQHRGNGVSQHRGNGDSQHRGNGVSQHRGNGDSQHRGNGDSQHRSRRSKTPDGLKSQGFCIGAYGRDDPAWLISETSEPRKSHIRSSPRRSEFHSGDGKYQSRKRESHLNYKGQHSSVKDDNSSLADYQPYQEELSPDHSEYQPSIMDYQPRHRNHKLGQRECQTDLSDKTVRDSSRESPRKRHVEKS